MNNTNKTNNKQEAKLIRIEVADASGHQTLMLSPEETQEFVEQQDNKWIFVDNTLIREGDLNSVNWDEADSVRVMPGLVGGANKLIRIEIADHTGHQTLMLSPEQTQEFIEQQDNKWIFVDNMLVRENDLGAVNWSETDSVRVMPGLVGGLNSNQSLLEEVLTDSRKQVFPPSAEKMWVDGRAERADGLIGCFEASLESNSKALALLKGVFEENSDSIRVGRNNIIILGDLASYCIPIKELLIPFHNVYSENSYSGFRTVEVHPKDHWIRKHKSACIQVKSDPQIPSIDTLTGLLLGLMNDRISFLDEKMFQLRNALIGLYGLETSPISDVMDEFLGQIYDGFQRLNGQFTVNGSNGWKWHIGFGDPEVTDFSISSSIREGPKRLIVEDTRSDGSYNWGNLELILDTVSEWPKAIKNGNDFDVLEKSFGFAKMCDRNRTFARIRAEGKENHNPDVHGYNHLEELFG